MKNIKLFEQFKGIESSLLESFLDDIEKESPETLKTAEVIDPKEPAQQNELFSVWQEWVELQFKFATIIGKGVKSRSVGEEETQEQIESEVRSSVSECTNWLNQETSIEDLSGEKFKNSEVVWLFYNLKEEIGQFSDFGIKSMYDLIKKKEEI